MHQEKKIKTYDQVVSLGAICQVAHHLRRRGLRTMSGPLDWFITYSPAQVTRLLGNRFAGFMDLKNLKVEGVHGESLQVRDTDYDCLSVHDFPLSCNSAERLQSYPEFRAKMDRRVARLLASLDDPDCSILFVRQFGRAADKDCWAWLGHELQECVKVLREGYRAQCEILAVTETDPADFGQSDWGLEQVRLARIPPSRPKTGMGSTRTGTRCWRRFG